MKSYLDTLERLGYAMPNELGVSLILNSLNKEYDKFVQNYNMHSMRKTLAELHAMLKLHEKGILKKAETPAVLAIHEGKIQKDKKKPQKAKGKAKGKNKLAYAPKTKIPSPPKRENPIKDSICHHYKEIGHWRRNYPSSHAESKKRKNASEASNSCIFTIKLYVISNNAWVYDTGYGTHICSTSQGLRKSRKLKHGALNLYMSNEMRAAVEAIKSFDLILPSGLIIVLDNCHYAPTITRGVVSISRLVKNGYIHTFTNYGIFVSKDNVFYFNAIPRDDIYEIDMHNLYPNRNGLLQPTHDESHEKCKSCISRKMKRKTFPHQVKRAKDLLGLIHTDLLWFFYLMKHRHELFETFTVFQNKVENELSKKIKDIQSDRGGEYMSHEFVNHMKSCGIVSELTPPYMPQHNGVSERRNQTLLDMVQSMMNLTTMLRSFWGYALEIAARILNIVSTKKGLLKVSESDKWLEIIQEEDTQPFENTRKEHDEVTPIKDEPLNYKAASVDLKSDKWLEAMNTEMQSMKDNQVWVLVELPPNRRTVRSKWLFKKKTDMDGNNMRFDEEIKKIGFTKNPDEPCVYLKASGSNVTFLVFYVDDMLLIGNNVAMLQEVKSWLCKCFSIKDLGEAAYILEIKIIHDRSKRLITFSQSAYLEKILKKFRMENSKKGYTPIMEKPDYRKSQEAEYIAAAEASMVAIWMRKFIDGLGGVMPSNKRPMEMLCDNKPALAIARDPTILKGARHF
nr:hypothetical protein [Tanacetum cinerariifolium]